MSRTRPQIADAWEQVDRTIDDEAWSRASRMMHLHEDGVVHLGWPGYLPGQDMERGGQFHCQGSDGVCEYDPLVAENFRLDNYLEWAGAFVLAARGVHARDMCFRPDHLAGFIASGHRNPGRMPGVPHADFYWTGHARKTEISDVVRRFGLLPDPHPCPAPLRGIILHAPFGTTYAEAAEGLAGHYDEQIAHLACKALAVLESRKG